MCASFFIQQSHLSLTTLASRFQGLGLDWPDTSFLAQLDRDEW